MLVLEDKLKSHMFKCGSKSRECDFCRKQIVNSKRNFHLAVKHDINPCLNSVDKLNFDKIDVSTMRFDTNLSIKKLALERYHDFVCPVCSKEVIVEEDFLGHIKNCCVFCF